jgi:hypothetical protein
MSTLSMSTMKLRALDSVLNKHQSPLGILTRTGVDVSLMTLSSL